MDGIDAFLARHPGWPIVYLRAYAARCRHAYARDAQDSGLSEVFYALLG